MTAYYIDANYILSYLLRDNNFEIAGNFFERAAIENLKLFSTELAIFEAYWVMTHATSQSKKEVCSILFNFLELGLIVFENLELLKAALRHEQVSILGLEDCYHLAAARHLNCSELETMDKKLNKAWSEVAV